MRVRRRSARQALDVARFCGVKLARRITPGDHALLHDHPERTLSAWSQTGRQTGQQDSGAHRRGAPQALAPRHLGSRKVARAGLRRLAQLLCRPGVWPVHPCVPPQAATPVDAGATPPVPASPIQLEATGAHDRNPVATRLHPPPMAGPAVYRQAPEVGAGWFNDHVRICAGDAQQYAFLPQLRGALGNQRLYRDRWRRRLVCRSGCCGIPCTVAEVLGPIGDLPTTTHPPPAPLGSLENGGC